MGFFKKQWQVEHVTNVSTGEAEIVGRVPGDTVEEAQHAAIANGLVPTFQTFRVRPVMTAEEAYRAPIAALREKGIEASLTNTGGGCLALTWELEDRYGMLTANEPLPEEPVADECLPASDPWWRWHLGIYAIDDGDVSGDPVRPVEALPYLVCERSHDSLMAEAVAKHWDHAITVARQMRARKHHPQVDMRHEPRSINTATKVREEVEAMDVAMRQVHEAMRALHAAWDTFPGDILTPDEGYPFAQSLEDQVSESYEYMPITSGSGPIVVRHLREAGIPATWEYPGVVHFTTIDGFEWATGLTGWHVSNTSDAPDAPQFVYDDILGLLDTEAQEQGRSMPLLTLLDRIVGAINAYNTAAANR